MAYKQSPIDFGEGTGSSPLEVRQKRVKRKDRKSLEAQEKALKSKASSSRLQNLKNNPGRIGNTHSLNRPKKYGGQAFTDMENETINRAIAKKEGRVATPLSKTLPGIKNGKPVDKNWTGKEKSGSKTEIKAFKKDRNEALKKGKFKKALNIQKDVKSSRKAYKKNKKANKEDKYGLTKNDKSGKSPASDGQGSILRQKLRRTFGSNKPK